MKRQIFLCSWMFLLGDKGMGLMTSAEGSEDNITHPNKAEWSVKERSHQICMFFPIGLCNFGLMAGRHEVDIPDQVWS